MSKIESHKFKYGSKFINYELEHRDRKTLEISVYPDLSVKVIAPLNKNFEEVEKKVRLRAAWILKQKDFFALFLPRQDEKKFFSGETHLYLGKRYRLKTRKSDCENVLLKRGLLEVSLKNRKDSVKIKQLLESWYKEKAKDKFAERLDICLKKFKKHDFQRPSLRIRFMKYRWGSCSNNGNINLNAHLIKAPTNCIDYVIAHELCHFKHYNHSKDFYKLFEKIMPDREKRKKRLESISI